MSDFENVPMARSSLNAWKRVKFSQGLVLGEKEFHQEQFYHMERDHRHVRLLHGSGILHGLGATLARETLKNEDGKQYEGWTVEVEPGLAVDLFGREIHVPSAQNANLDDWFFRNNERIPDLLQSPGDRINLLIGLRYLECETDPVPVVADIDGGAGRAPSRIESGFQLSFITEPVSNPATALTSSLIDLLGRIEFCYGPSGITVDDLKEHVRNLPEMPERKRMLVNKNDRAEYLHAAFEAWTRSVLPRLRESGRDNESGMLVLAELALTVNQTQEGLWLATEAELISKRPADLLSTGLIQELLIRGLGSETRHTPKDYKGGGNDLCDPDLTRIVSMSWSHRGPFETVKVRLADKRVCEGLVVGFGKREPDDGGKVMVGEGSLDTDTFRLIVEKDSSFSMADELQVIRPEAVIPVERSEADQQAKDRWAITEVIETKSDAALEPAAYAALVLDNQTVKRLTGKNAFRRMTVIIKGDFVFDETESRVIDAHFLRGELPTGQRGKALAMNLGLQGGVFESWMQPESKRGEKPETPKKKRRARAKTNEGDRT